MKSLFKFGFTIIILFLNTQLYAQFTATANGEIINNNDIITFTTTDEAEATMDIVLTNNSDATQEYSLEVIDLINADGSSFQVCVSLCYNSIFLHEIFPPRNSGVELILEPGTSTPENFIHLLNTNEGNGTFPMDYVFSLYEIDSEGNQQGTPLNFTYRYDPTAGINENTIEGVIVIQSPENSSINISAPEELSSIKIFDSQGRMLVQKVINTRSYSLNLSGLNTPFLILVCNDQQGRSFTKKIINY